MVIFSVLLLLLSNAVTLRRDKSILFSRIAIIILLYCCMLVLQSLHFSYLDRGIGLFGGLYHATSTTHVFHVFIFIISACILQLTGFYPRKISIPQYCSIYKFFFFKFIYYNSKISNKMGQQFSIIEYPLIIIFIITGAIFLVSSSDLVSIFISIELQSYGLYLLSTIYRNSELATSGGLMYFLLGGLSSCFILLGSSLFYANSGTTNLDGLYIITSLSEITTDNSNNILYWYKPYYIHFSLLIMSIGFLFKISAAPFHFWAPDVYDAIPTVVTTFVAIIAKISIFLFLLELVHYAGNTLVTGQLTWLYNLLVSSLLSLIVGTIVGLTQSRIKRLFAYSTISHVGFILLALSINSIESIQAFIFYLLQYTVSNLNAFIILITIGYTLYCYGNEDKQYKQLTDKNNSPIQLISQIKGYFYINPFISLSLAITIFSFVGVPPFIGFFAKQMVLSAALDSGYIFIVLIAILSSVVSAVYYLAIIKQIFFFKPDYSINSALKNLSLHGSIINNKNNFVEKVTFSYNNLVLSSSLSVTVSILTLIISLFIFVPQEWLSLANILALILFNP